MNYVTVQPLIEKVINLSSFEHNLLQIKKYLKNTKILAVVKADAYGHGMEDIALTCMKNGVDFFGVATAIEAIKLRQFLNKQQIGNNVNSADKTSVNNISPKILCWIYDIAEKDIQVLAENNIDISISNLQQIDALKKASEILNTTMAGKNIQIRVHIKIDTGMGRAGVSWQNLQEVIDKIKIIEKVKIVGLFSHLACADEIDNDYTNEQINKFEKAIKICNKNNLKIEYKHLGASSGILFHPNSHYDMVRAGIIMYGLSPNPSRITSEELHIKPVMTVQAKIVQIKKMCAGSKISYGGTYTLKKDSYIAIIPIGYADGIPRIISNNWKVEIKGKLYKQIGRICMDQFMVDLGENLDCVKVSDIAVVLGEKNSADEMAEVAQTINYEILVNMINNNRMATKYVYDN